MARRLLIPRSIWTGLLVLTMLRAFAQPVINEIHYDPPTRTEPAEFIELFNPGNAPAQMGGWRLSGGVEFVFPSGTVLPAQAYLVIAQDPALLAQKFGATALGPWTGRLRNEDERVELRDAADDVVDRVDFQLGFPWPTVGEPPGYSAELIHPSLDNELGGNWRASVVGGGAAGARRVLFEARGEWRFFRGVSEPSSPPTAWREEDFPDEAWEPGALPIGYDPALALGTPLEDMRGNYSAVFLRRRFSVSNPAEITSLELEALYDDGFKVWINGRHLLDVNIASGELPHDASAGPARESNAYETFQLAIPPGLLRSGENLIAVQAHNSSLTASSDFYFDARLIAISGPTGRGPTPGRVNVVFATNAPPAIRQVAHTPEAPRSAQPVTLSARVTDPDGTTDVTLLYQVVDPGAYLERGDPEYETRWVSLPMRDDGLPPDLTSADGVFTATIPGSVQQHRRLIRYRIEARDTLGLAVRVPHPDDPQPNFAYFVYDGVPAWTGSIRPGGQGTPGEPFTVSSAEMNRLPVIHLLAKQSSTEESTWLSRYGGDAYPWSGTLVFNGKVYDHIRHRARGGVWRYAMAKNMWKFDFNRGHDFQAVDDWGRPLKTQWAKLNLGASIQQGDFNHRGEQGMFESVGFRIFRLAGVPAVNSAYVQFRVIDHPLEAPAANQYEGDFWGVYLMLEQPDGRFLEQHGLPEGNLYKMEGGGGELNHLGPAGPADSSDLNNLLQAYGSGTESWWRQNFKIPNYLSYQTVVQAIHHYDICYDKNFFYYLDPQEQRWQVIPWDLDLTWAENMYDSGCGGADRIKQRLLPNATKFPATWRAWQNRIREFRDLFWNQDEAFRLIDEQAGRLRGPATGPTLLDADRAQWDYNPRMTDSTYSTSPDSKGGWGRFYRWPNYAANVARRDFEGCLQLMKRYVGFRATNSLAEARSLDSIAADAAIPTQPTLANAGATNFPVNDLRLRCSAYQGTAAFGLQRWRVGEITPAIAPSWTAETPWKYEIEAAWESGDLRVFNPEITLPPSALRAGARYRARVQFEDAAGRTSHWSAPVEFVAGEPDNAAALAGSLKLTELMFNAPGGSTNDFLELHNAGTAPLQLGGLSFTSGIEYVIAAGTVLDPGGYLIVTKAGAAGNFAGFRAFYGLAATVPVIGPYDGNLANDGERVVLTGAGGGDLITVTYQEGRGWPVAADGAGHSLVPRGDFGEAASGALDFGGNWRDSASIKGSPGRADPEPDTTLVLNELVAHTDFLSEFDSNDWIELFNRAETAVTLGEGWFLSDDGGELKRWQIPPGTQIPGHGRVVFDEVTGFNNPRGTGFAFDKAGEAVFLSHFPQGTPGRVVDAVSFKGQENEWALARVPDGGPFWDAVIPRTRSAPNAALLPRVTLDELLYHEGGIPTNAVPAENLEFIELHNATAAAVPLYNPHGAWQLSGGIEFSFPIPTTLAPGERIVVVNFDPRLQAAILAGFRQTLNVPAAARVFGPYAGRLGNDTDRVALERPQPPDLPGEPISWVIVDEVDYYDSDPWPGGADGVGRSYQRRSGTRPGNDPANWSAAVPTPGSPPPAPDPDRDGDGMPDAWEIQYGLDPDDPDDAIADADSDGAINRDEHLAGTDPKDAGSALRFQSIGYETTGSILLRFEAIAGRTYAVESSPAPGQSGWETEQSVPAGTGNSLVEIRVQQQSETASRFFRLRLI